MDGLRERVVALRQNRVHSTGQLNPHAERFVLSVKSECLARMIFFSEGQLRRAVTSYVGHYHGERNHQGLGNRVIEGTSVANEDGEVLCNERLGGLLKYYYRKAA